VRLKTARGTRQLKRILSALAEIEPNGEVPFDRLVGQLDSRTISDTFVVGVLLDESRERSAMSNLQRQRNTQVRLISVDSPAFAALFEPPPAEGTS